ncbi:hypothetical protein [Paenibacillus sp. MMS18-CY102]|uniref:hypothetical protein n=1 Tax=Paenibacillus sp. MMS18-CY102 TaxID=2682849 RepID=UPI0013654D3E|nr:hypothetical protein [Paenibacillus sp. MMS18-CY102]MWC31038.1 hypothetical protein [Paenibacillus sp. MMS18-CY102]
MKLKKSLMASMAALSILSFASSANAATGFADNYYSAQSLASDQIYQGSLSAPNDVDWFTWTNTTGQSVNFTVSVLSQNKNFDLQFVINPPYNPALHANDNGANSIDTIYGNNLPPGATVHWYVEGHSSSDYGPSGGYVTWLHVN